MENIYYKLMGVGIGLVAVFLSVSMILLNNENRLISDGSQVYQSGISAMSVVSGDSISLYAVNQEMLDSIIKINYSNLEAGKETRLSMNSDLAEFKKTGIHPGKQVEIIKSDISKDDATLLTISQGSTGMIVGAMPKLISLALPLILLLMMLTNAEKILPTLKGWVAICVVFVAIFSIEWTMSWANDTNKDFGQELYEKYTKNSLISNGALSSHHAG